MGCGSSALGCCKPTSGSSVPTVIPLLAATPAVAPPTAASATPGCTASCLRYSSTAAAVPNKELASGRSQLERGYQQLPLGVPLKDWDDLHVRMWLLTLPPVLRPYTDMLCSPGGLLLEWSDELLTEAGVINTFHRKQLLVYVRQLEADVAARLQQQGGAGLSEALVPGCIDSPRVGSTDYSGVKLPRTVLQHHHHPKHDGPLDCDADPEIAGSRTPAESTSLKRPHSTGNSAPGSISGGEDDVSLPRRRGSIGGTSTGGPVANRSSREDVNRLAEYEQGWVEQGVSYLKVVVRKIGAMCPWPGDAAAQLLGALLDMGEKALINRRNWHQLNVRAVDLLQLIASNKQLQADTHVYRSIMHRLINTLKGIREYYIDYTNRNWLSRIVVGVGRDQYMFAQLWDALGALVADASLGLQVATVGGQEMAAKALDRLQKRQARYDDEEGRLRGRIEDLGGVEALLRDPGQLAQVATGLGVGDQLTLHKIEEALSLLEADRSEGVHSLIPHPDLRVLWRKCFASLQEVSWALWWAAFPMELARVPVEQLVIAALSSRLLDTRRRRAFERRVDVTATGRISVVDLRRTVAADADIRDVVAQLTERLSLDGDGDADTITIPAASSSPAHQSEILSEFGLSEFGAPNGGAKGLGQGGSCDASPPALTGTDLTVSAGQPRPLSPAPSLDAAPAPYASLEPRCSLPPLDSDRFVGREEDVRQVAERLMAGPSVLQHHHRGKNDTGSTRVGTGRNSSGAGIVWPLSPLAREEPSSRGGVLDVTGSANLQEQSLCINRPHAICIVAEPGMGKSALAVAVARRLWEGGSLPGGAYYVDLQGADCRAEVVARFAGALGVAKADHGDAAGTAGVSLALQALAARGALLLVLDGVDCLDDIYDNLGSDMCPVDSAGNVACNMDGDAAAVAVAQDDAGVLGSMLDAEPEAVLSELLAVVPSARVLLTNTEPLELRSREVEYVWLGPLPEPAAVALVQDLARCLTWEEARQLAMACSMSTLALRLAASAVATGAVTLRDAMARARNATALVASTPRAGSPGGIASGSGAVATPTGVGGLNSSVGATGSGPTPVSLPPGPCGAVRPGGGSMGPSIQAPTTPRLLRSQSPLAVQDNRFRSPQTPSGHRIGGSSGLPTATRPPAHGMTQCLPDGSTASDKSAVPDSPGLIGVVGSNAGTPSSAQSSDAHGNIRHQRPNASFARSMSFLLRASQVSGGGASTGVSAALMPPLLQQTFSTRGGTGGGASGRTYGSGAAVAAALLEALGEEHRTALVQLSIMPGSWDEDTASALLGKPPYAARALLDVLLGYSLIVCRGCSGSSIRGSGGLGAAGGGYSQGRYSLMPGMLDAARAQLAELDTESRVALQCRFVGHVLSQFLRADRLYREGAVRAAMQLASEQRQDVQAMLLVAAHCNDSERMLWGTIGTARLPALATSSLFSALVLDTSAEMDAFWRAVADAAAAAAAAPGGATSGIEAGRYDALAALAARVLAQTLHKQARYEGAEAAWRGALLQAQRIHGSGSLEAAACHSGLGLALSALRRDGEAEEQHAAALRLRKAVLGDRHADVAASLSDLARVMRHTGRYREAEAAYQKVLQVRRKLLGEEHPAVADTYISAGITAGLQKRHLDEEHFYRKALAIRQRTLGPDHPEVAQAINNIGTALSSQGKHAAAEQVFRKALDIKRKVLGPSHQAVGTTLNNIARALRYQSKLAEAEVCCRQAIAVLEASLGVKHPSVTTAVSNLIQLLKIQGKEGEGAAVYQAYRPRRSKDHVAAASEPFGDKGLAAIAARQPPSEAALTDASGAAAAMAVTAAPSPLRPGKPPLAPQGSRGHQQQVRAQQQKQVQLSQPDLRVQASVRARTPLPRPRPLDLHTSVTESQAASDSGGNGPVSSRAGVCAKGGFKLDAGPPELNARLDASSLQLQALVEAARAVQLEMQGLEACSAQPRAVT
ncbi:hypothetical protein VaNZ11_000134 [Volvox africanus]|uniref:AAA+ ATPase domain-containing protein n=1 Tax=Volvox africanus TaxID=51714 RepID=A0ABQ5RM63_9CHLO|nr:hypothetical protein VaNZ11_000134 [Volvox africanus]